MDYSTIFKLTFQDFYLPNWLTIFYPYFPEFGKDERYRQKFKKKDSNKSATGKKVPKRLQVSADDPDAKMKGYLYKHSKSSGGWKKVWIVLKSSVIFELRAASDAVAQSDDPILGWNLEPEYILEVGFAQCAKKKGMTLMKIYLCFLALWARFYPSLNFEFCYKKFLWIAEISHFFKWFTFQSTKVRINSEGVT